MRLQEEIKELEQRFAQAPDSRLFLPLADALRRAGELERAVKLCREGLLRYGDFNSARILLGETLTEMGQLDEAGRELEQAAALDKGSSRITTLLTTIAGKRGDGQVAREVGNGGDAGQAENGELSGEQAEQPADQPVQQQRNGTGDELTNGAGEMFITHTLGDIYRMQGHDLKALEVYRKLLEEGHDDPELKRKADELARKLAGNESAGGTDEVSDNVPATQPVVAVIDAPQAAGEGPFEERIDAIFHFLLGDSPEHAETAAPAAPLAAAAGKGAAGSGSSDFVDMLEEWVGDLRRGM